MKTIPCIFVALLMASGASAQSDAADSFDLTGLSPEDQTPLGKFTTAAEIGPIMEMTKNNWAAVRELDGEDLVYFTQILSWRCGMISAKFSINGAPLQDLELPECHMKYQQPNVLIDEEPLLTFRRFGAGSVDTIRIDILLDDLTTQTMTLQRDNILIP